MPSVMKVDFQDAARRHWSDAELLHREARLANADQLYGLAAECVLKRLAIGLGWVTTTTDGDLAKSATSKAIRRHVDGLWGEFQARQSGLTSRTWSLLLATNPFADWSIDQRYCAAADVPDEPRLSAHRAAAEASLRALDEWALSQGTP